VRQLPAVDLRELQGRHHGWAIVQLVSRLAGPPAMSGRHCTRAAGGAARRHAELL
jgi:hypothetical protein